MGVCVCKSLSKDNIGGKKQSAWAFFWLSPDFAKVNGNGKKKPILQLYKNFDGFEK